MNIRLAFILLLAFLFGCTTQYTNMVGETDVSKLPALYITLPADQLESILQDKEQKAVAHALLVTNDGDTLYDGELTHVKTRGNSTFQSIKKPFAIKFPKKQRLFGLNKSKSYVLLANAMDESHIRNAIAFDLGRALGLPSTNYVFLSLYFNNEYYGLYQLTNKVEVGKHTLNIIDLDKENERVNHLSLSDYSWFGYGTDQKNILRKGTLLEHSPDDYTGGYLLELGQSMGYYEKRRSGFIASNGDMIGIRSPEYASEEEVEYIKGIYDSVIEALDVTSGKNLEDYMDIHSFGLYFLLQEVLQNVDGCIASFFMYKDQGEPFLHAGPVWDFDLSINNIYAYGTYFMPNELSVRRRPGSLDLASEPSKILYLFWHNPQFCKYVANLYLNTVSPKFHAYFESGHIDTIVQLICFDVERDNEKYHLRQDTLYDTSLQRVLPFLENRLDFLDWYFSSDSSERVCVIDVTDKANPRYLYIPKNSGFALPEPVYIGGFNNHSPIPIWYYEGTNIEFLDGTVLNDNCSIEVRWREPTKKEVLMRRVHKKLKKWKIVA